MQRAASKRQIAVGYAMKVGMLHVEMLGEGWRNGKGTMSARDMAQ